MKPNIVVIGSSNVDMIIQVPRLPRPGETIGEGVFSRVHGGKGANQAVAAARAGGAVTFISCVGDDLFGTAMVESFEEDGIATQHVRRITDTASGVALILVDSKGENSIAVAPGANYALHPKHINQATQAIEAADLLLLQLEVPYETVRYAIHYASQKNKKVLLNPAPARKLGEEILRQLYILIINETEAEMLSGMKVGSDEEVAAAARALLKKGPRIIILTLGKRGAYVATDKLSEWVPGFSVKAVDTTAAGDVFCGSLSVALGEKQSLIDAVRFASASAAISVTRLGAQPSAPKREEVLAFLENQIKKEES